ncbi:MAG TPA: biliverdin-producing heme oxygenase [Kofleriaceae bacterium]|nr:biliverdin-producing heme oxygenase [Kofleriaceae bacterium]
MFTPTEIGSAASREHVVSLREKLKRETTALHHGLETQLGLLERPLSLARYRRVLEAFYGFYAPIEIALSRLAAADTPAGFSLRARAGLIERDLVALGLSRRELTELPWCAELPTLSRREHLAGCLYVLEGACLGGQVIAKALKRRLEIAKGTGASFFVGDGDATAARWLQVLDWLEDLERGGARTEQIVASACATFLTLARWLEQRGVSS